MEKLINQGWECPKCGRVYSPTTPMCFHCVPGKVQTIGATGTGDTGLCNSKTTGDIEEERRLSSEVLRTESPGVRMS